MTPPVSNSIAAAMQVYLADPLLREQHSTFGAFWTIFQNNGHTTPPNVDVSDDLQDIFSK